MSNQKNLPMDQRFKDSLSEYAYRRRLSMSAAVGEVIHDIAEGSTRAPANGYSANPTVLKYTATPDWEHARERARAVGVPLATWIKNELSLRMVKEGMFKDE